MSDYEKPPTKRRRRLMGLATQLVLAAVLMLAFFRRALGNAPRAHLASHLEAVLNWRIPKWELD